MRAALFILAGLGFIAICLVVVISTGLVGLSSIGLAIPRVARVALARQPSGVATPTDGQDSATDGSDDATTGVSATQPSGSFTDRSIFLAAADAALSGSGIQLMGRSDQVIRRGDASAVPAFPEPGPQEFFGPRFGRGGRRGQREFSPYLTRWLTPADSAAWDVNCPLAGAFTITFIYTCPKVGDESQGAPFRLSAAGQQVTIAPDLTASATVFEIKDVGQIDLPAGHIRLTITLADEPAHKTRLRLRSIRLFPRT